MASRSVFQRHVAFPSEHGAWVFLGTPLAIGSFAAPAWTVDSLALIVACLAGFLLRQPITLVVKTLAGRRSRDTVGAACFWIAVYATLCLPAAVFLGLGGYVPVLALAVPAVAVLGWHLWLVSRRAERRQWLVELIASGVLALAAPAAFWVGSGGPDPAGWWLWGASWAQGAASILNAYARLGQRNPARAAGPGPGVSFALSLANLIVAAAMSWTGVWPGWAFAAFLPQWIESVEAVRRPSIRVKPATIGFRQLTVSVLFTVIFIVCWRR